MKTDKTLYLIAPTLFICTRSDRFDLLTAYLDGEVTAAFRQQIQHWLRSDLEVQRLYARALQLRLKW